MHFCDRVVWTSGLWAWKYLTNMEVSFVKVPETAKEESFGRKGEGPFPLDKVKCLKAFIPPR